MVEETYEPGSTVSLVARRHGVAPNHGFVESLARPGGNVTGTSLWTPEIAGKQLDFLKEVAPILRKVGVLRSPSATHNFILPQLESRPRGCRSSWSRSWSRTGTIFSVCSLR